MPSACCQEYRARLMLGLSAAMAGSFQRVTVHRYMFARVAAFSFRLPLLAPARGTPAVSAAPRPPATQATALLRGYCTAHAGRQPVVAPCSSRYQGGAHVAVWALPGLPRPAAARTLRCPHMQVMRTRGRPRGAPRPPCNVRGGFGRGGGGGGGVGWSSAALLSFIGWQGLVCPFGSPVSRYDLWAASSSWRRGIVPAPTSLQVGHGHHCC